LDDPNPTILNHNFLSVLFQVYITGVFVETVVLLEHAVLMLFVTQRGEGSKGDNGAARKKDEMGMAFGQFALKMTPFTLLVDRPLHQTTRPDPFCWTCRSRKKNPRGSNAFGGF